MRSTGAGNRVIDAIGVKPMSVNEICSRTGLGQDAVKRDLKILIREGRVKKIGDMRGERYSRIRLKEIKVIPSPEIKMKDITNQFLEWYFRIPTTRFISAHDLNNGNRIGLSSFYRCFHKYIRFGLVEKELKFRDGQQMKRHAHRAIHLRRKYSAVMIDENGNVTFIERRHVQDGK